jgi:hypothetical protein
MIRTHGRRTAFVSREMVSAQGPVSAGVLILRERRSGRRYGDHWQVEVPRFCSQARDR